MSFSPGLLHVLRLRSIRGVRFLLGPGEDVTGGLLAIGCFSGVVILLLGLGGCQSWGLLR